MSESFSDAALAMQERLHASFADAHAKCLAVLRDGLPADQAARCEPIIDEALTLFMVEWSNNMAAAFAAMEGVASAVEQHIEQSQRRDFRQSSKVNRN